MTSLVTLVCLCLIAIVKSDDPPGHLQRIGSHMPPIEVEIRDTVPDPIEFFDEYIKPGKAVIFKGAAKVFPEFTSWKKDEYLRKKFGRWLLGIEVGKYEGSIFGKFKLMSFKKFLDTYTKDQFYLIQSIDPDNNVTKDISLLKSVSCGGYEENINQIMMFFSSGGTNSALHVDSVENLHCVLDGTKDWVLFDRKHRPLIPLMEDYNAYGAMDTRSVDMYKYPIVQHLPWHHAFLDTGDCLYLPYGWFHHVKSSDTRNLALALWINYMHHLPNVEDCPEDLTKLPEYKPLQKFAENEYNSARSSIWTLFMDGPDVMPKSEYFERCTNFPDMNETVCGVVFEIVDKNRDDLLTSKEVLNVESRIADDEFDFLKDRPKIQNIGSKNDEESKDEL